MRSSFIRRGKLLGDFIKETSSKGEVVIICGAVDRDLHVAANTKSFLIAAGWVTREEKVTKYGIPAPTPEKMRALIEIIVNQTSWHYLCTFDDPVPFQPRSKKNHRSRHCLIQPLTKLIGLRNQTPKDVMLQVC